MIVDLIVPSADPGVASRLSAYEWVAGPWAHVASFVAGLALLYLAKSDYSRVNAIAFAIIAFNVLLVISGGVAFHPARDPYFGVSLLLFLTAALIPWRPGYQIVLAATAASWFLFLQWTLYAAFPEFRDFWASYAQTARGSADGLAAARHHAIWGVTGSAILGGASAVVSYTLYSLRKTAHRARRLGKYTILKEIGRGADIYCLGAWPIGCSPEGHHSIPSRASRSSSIM